MARREQRSFTKEFKSAGVKLVCVGGRSFRDLVRSLDLPETSLREWLHEPCSDQAGAPTGR